MPLRAIVLAVVAAATTAAAQSLAAPSFLAPSFDQQQLMNAIQRNTNSPARAAVLYEAHNFSAPVDHFHNDSRYEPHSNDAFDLRYWFDATYYKPGGPVLLFCSGESAADGATRVIQKGIIHKLAEATNGIGVVLEHRYYGKSFPVPDLTAPESYRFLTTDQAMADIAYFASHAVFPGLEQYNLTASHTPWIAYGGSYAGALVSILRTLYPDVFWGAISSSGVTQATWDNREYLDVLARYGPADCVHYTGVITQAMDTILLHNTSYAPELRALWNWTSSSNDPILMSIAATGILSFQSQNWNPATSSPFFQDYCSNITSPSVRAEESTERQSSAEKLIAAGGYGDEAKDLAPHLLNWIWWVTNAILKPASPSSNSSSKEAVRLLDPKSQAAEAAPLSDAFSWPYQFCTQWGFMLPGDTQPADQLPMISRLITLEYRAAICQQRFNLSGPAKTEEITKYGGRDISYPRLAQIGGEWDPWRPFTPLADALLDKPSSVSEPRIVIPQAIHVWDAGGLLPNETTDSLPPPSIKNVQAQEVEFVKAWLADYPPAYPT